MVYFEGALSTHHAPCMAGMFCSCALQPIRTLHVSLPTLSPQKATTLQKAIFCRVFLWRVTSLLLHNFLLLYVAKRAQFFIPPRRPFSNSFLKLLSSRSGVIYLRLRWTGTKTKCWLMMDCDWRLRIENGHVLKWQIKRDQFTSSRTLIMSLNQFWHTMS